MKSATLGVLSRLHYGKALSDYKDNLPGDCPFKVFGTNGSIGWAKKPLFSGPSIIIGRKGAYRETHWAEADGWVIDTAYYLTLNQPDEINLRWLYYKLKTIDLNRLDSGAAIPSTKREDFYAITIQYPKFDIQQLIVERLNSYDDLIENNRRRIQLLEESARLLYQEWFVHLRFPGHEQVKITDGVPEGWSIKRVDSLLGKVAKKKKIKKEEYLEDGVVPCVDQSQEFIGGYIDDEEAAITENLPVVVFGDHTRIVKFIDFPFAPGADGTQLLVPNDEEIPRDFFYFVISSINVANAFYARHFKFLKAKDVLVPEKKLMHEFSLVVKDNMLQIKLLRNQNRSLAKARDLLLPKLMSGELTV